MRYFLYAFVLMLVVAGTTFLILGAPVRPNAAGARSSYHPHYWAYRHYGGGHGGWMGRSFGWGTFGEFERDDDGFSGGGPGYGK